MSKSILRIFTLLFLSLFLGCSNLATYGHMSSKKPYKKYNKSEIIIPSEENVREIPNGEIIGRTMKGESFELLERRGNWLLIKNNDFPSGFIWAPSLGFKKYDMFALESWYDLKEKAFYPISQYEKMLGKVSEIDEYFNMKRYFFRNLGLGFNQETIMDQNGKAETKKIQKGIAIIINADGQTKEIHLDLKKTIQNISQLEKLLKVKLDNPGVNDDTRLAWQQKYGLTEIRLLRSEFKSDNFNQIVLMQ